MNMKQNPTKFHHVLIQITPRNLLNKSVKEFPLHLKTGITSRFKLYNHSQNFVDHQIPLYLAEIFFFFLFFFWIKKGSPMWAHWPHATWRQWVIPRVSHGPYWGYHSNSSSLGAERELLPSSHTLMWCRNFFKPWMFQMPNQN